MRWDLRRKKKKYIYNAKTRQHQAGQQCPEKKAEKQSQKKGKQRQARIKVLTAGEGTS